MKKAIIASVLMTLVGVFAIAPSIVDAKSDALPAPKVIVAKYDADW